MTCVFVTQSGSRKLWNPSWPVFYCRSCPNMKKGDRSPSGQGGPGCTTACRMAAQPAPLQQSSPPSPPSRGRDAMADLAFLEKAAEQKGGPNHGVTRRSLSRHLKVTSKQPFFGPPGLGSHFGGRRSESGSLRARSKRILERFLGCEPPLNKRRSTKVHRARISQGLLTGAELLTKPSSAESLGVWIRRGRIPVMQIGRTVNPRTKSLDFRGFDSSRFLTSRRGIPRSIGDFLKI